MKNKIIYLDIDGVLSNWVKKTCELFGKEENEVVSAWELGTFKIEEALGVSYDEVVKTVNDVTKVTAETFAKCDVIVSNWTCHPVMTGGPWTPEGKKALVDAISRGEGMVQFHAASAACNDWAEFQQIAGLSWKDCWID